MCMVYPEEICRLFGNSADFRETLQTSGKLCRLQGNSADFRETLQT